MGDDDSVSVAAALVSGHLVSLSIRAAVELGVFDALEFGSSAAGADLYGEATLELLADRLQLELRPLTRLLSVLADLGLVARLEAPADPRRAPGTDPGSPGYRLTRVGATFVKGHPSHMRDLVLMRTERSILDSWHRLADALRTESAVFEAVNGVDYWTYLADHPDQGTLFNKAMARRGVGQAEALISAGAVAGRGTLMDVGGGEGAMIAELVRRNPDVTGVVADLPEVAAAANAEFARQGLSGRASGVAADFFSEVPAGADAYALCNVLHDWDDDDCRRILRNVRVAMTPGKPLWVVERHLDSHRAADALQDLHLMDLHMLVMFGARERTSHEYKLLLLSSGFSVTSVSTGQVWDVIGGRAD